MQQMHREAAEPAASPSTIPIVLWDETGTSSAARDRIRAALGEAAAGRAATPAQAALRRRQALAFGGSGMPPAVDAEAAVVLLESFLAAAREGR